jgi:hypothetical protein
MEQTAAQTTTALSMDDTSEARLEKGALIAGRYRLERELGRGGFAVTWQAHDQLSGSAVAVKVLSIRSIDHWKAVELFEREARVLKNLDHPQIPKYLDFIAPAEGSDRFVLVQALAPGRSLDAWVKSGWRPTEAEARDLTEQLLLILEHLHGRSPPVVHRDIKPANIMRDERGRISLIDFGSVRERLQSASDYASTAGTFGYMAPEQLTGRATPASDLYGLGATLVNVLSHRAPDELPQHELRVDFRGAVNVSANFERFLSRLLAPAPEQRFVSAHAARIALARGVREDGHRLGSFAAERLVATVEPAALTIEIAGKRYWFSLVLALGTLAATLAFLVGGLSGDVSYFQLFMAAVTGLMTWSIGARAVRGFTDTRLRIDPEGATVQRHIRKLKVHERKILRGEPLAIATRGLFFKRDLVLHSREGSEDLGSGLDKRAVGAIEARIRQVEADLA